jgi:hypothetical protein
MTTFVEYQLDDDTTILIEATEETGGVVKVSARGSNRIIEAEKKFSDAFHAAKIQAKVLLKELDELPVNEAEIKFGITTEGEVGNMAIGKIGLGVNYEVTLKWKKPEVKI